MKNDDVLIKVLGRVKWFNQFKGYGFVDVEGFPEDIFLHFSVIAQAGLTRLNNDDVILCNVAKCKKGYQVIKIIKVVESSKYDLDSTLSYNSIVMPVLINYGIPINQSLFLFVEGGPQVSFITSDLKDTKSSYSSDPESRILFSAIAGIGASYAFSPAMALVTDLRYDLGFSTIKTEDSAEGVIPRGLNFSAGFHVKF